MHPTFCIEKIQQDLIGSERTETILPLLRSAFGRLVLRR